MGGAQDKVWRMGTESWVFHNGELYGKSPKEHYTKQLKEVDVQIRQQYKYDTQQVRVEDRTLFLLPVEVQI